MTLNEAKQKLIDAGRILEAEGQGDLTRGHISVRVPGDPTHFLMKPHSHGFDEITEDNIVVCNLEGEKVSGGGRRHSEVFIHSEIFRVRPDVTSVIHAHPTHAVALSATGQPLEMISQPSVHFADGLPYYTDTMNLIRTQEMGAGVARALGSSKAVLMRNHGVAVVGRSIEESVVLSLLLDNACRIQLLTKAAGGTGETFSPEDVARLHDAVTRAEQFAINFEFLRRKVNRGLLHSLV
ncbi:putative class II aldolase (plasmid) [Burkholderia sp. SFA1]|uniref:class II aldolase/adducin family protein n=1 Tax=unclassified Caballeronia TaxID=2646786 RepID=UPI001F442DB1|nr:MULTISPECIES: class II aldolase/adducin family protein [unclassified Caballeronia]MCE4546690.1 class II aldolase/adducin family protein [Caballeronia sp. PC1]MCE4572837.1 class II aldolase/adducin family protein [Caballeronia sp. CLC5]BBQ01785.1 putative class II aldolase [Burkholderia sp. SFA1]